MILLCTIMEEYSDKYLIESTCGGLNTFCMLLKQEN